MFIVGLAFFALQVCSASDPSKVNKFDLFRFACVESFWPKGQPLVGVTAPGNPLTWLEMNELCNAQHPGYALATRIGPLAEAAKTFCPAAILVPLRRNEEMVSIRLLGDNLLNVKEGHNAEEEAGPTEYKVYEALYLPTSEPISIHDATTFNCAVCQVAERNDVLSQGFYPPHNNSIYAYDLKLVSNKPFDDIALLANGSDLTKRLIDDLALAFKISEKEQLRWHGAKLNEERKAVVHIYYDRQEGSNISWFFYEHWHDQYVAYDSIDGFAVTLIKLYTECLHDKVYMANVRHELVLTGDVEVTLNTLNPALSTRECVWNADPEVEAAEWGPSFNWWILWGMCKNTVGTLVERVGLRDQKLATELKKIELEFAFGMQLILRTSAFKSMFKTKAIVGLTSDVLVNARGCTQSTHY